jgi:hypothetical protein
LHCTTKEGAILYELPYNRYTSCHIKVGKKHEDRGGRKHEQGEETRVEGRREGGISYAFGSHDNAQVATLISPMISGRRMQKGEERDNLTPC